MWLWRVHQRVALPDLRGRVARLVGCVRCYRPSGRNRLGFRDGEGRAQMGGECKYVCAKEVGCAKDNITRERWLALHSAALVPSPPFLDFLLQDNA